jgi:hypothetical protein
MGQKFNFDLNPTLFFTNIPEMEDIKIINKTNFVLFIILIMVKLLI